MTLTDEAAANLSASVAMLRDALAPLIDIVADRCSGLSAEDWAALEDARQALAQSDVRADAAPRWWTCRTHGPAQASSWGCPDCVREMRGEAQHLRAALQEADTLLGHDDNATEWRERWAGLWLNDWLGAWVPVSKRMPASGVVVLACYRNALGNWRRIRACWIAAKTVEAGSDSGFGEYDESTDTYYDPEGWYEQIDNWPEYTACTVEEGNVTHWMPLPAPPQAQNA